MKKYVTVGISIVLMYLFISYTNGGFMSLEDCLRGFKYTDCLIATILCTIGINTLLTNMFKKKEKVIVEVIDKDDK